MAKRRKHGRDVNGILLLDKPSGVTSNHALQRVKRLFNANKAGHTGILDPLATGMLPICLGEATKISAYLLDGDKRYRAECRLGMKTTTGDSEGEVISETPVPVLTPKDIEKVLTQFRGEIEQVPPMYSALKHQGQPLYKLARQGKEVERKPRRVTIHSLSLMAYSTDGLVLDVHCSKGTYIRTLAEDIGECLGCGAHLTGLRRLASGPFQDGMVTFERLEELTGPENAALDALLLTTDTPLRGWPEAVVGSEIAGYFRQGQAVWLPNMPTEGMLRLYERSDGQAETVFFGIGHVLDDGRIAPKRLISVTK